ncbi:MAG TPA: ADP-ribosylglycohydrolase family protein [Candidatus Eisenbacteria bacterium]|nr:ADP-ribosylglycohydrolase family protein [Candidatus Eisenbacteria bacterium]
MSSSIAMSTRESDLGSEQDWREAFVGVLLGTAVGDALGLPAENLSPERIRRRWRGEWRMRLVFGRGMISDDTEHTLLVAQALFSHPDDAAAFQRALGWKLRWWFAGLPGGVGLATAKACLRLWIGFSASKAAVASAGSGPAMRSAIIGAYFAEDADRRRQFVSASSRLTHRGWQAETAAMAVSECVALAVRTQDQPEVQQVLSLFRGLSGEQQWQTVLSRMETSLAAQMTVPEFVRTLGLDKGVTGYSLHVVPVAIYAWLRHPRDFRTAMISALECGGDTDTVGAILGAMSGGTVGKQGMPNEWLASVCEWPHSVTFMERVASRLAEQKDAQNSLGPVRYFWPGLIPRNLIFLAVVLAHGFRRLAPPY